MPGPYEEIYGVGLLDDLHNYFPALLYEHGRFQNLTQVLHYVRHQMNSRFNLYAYGASRASSLSGTATAPEPDGIPIFHRTSIPVSVAGSQTHTILVDLLSSFLTPDTATATPATTPWTSFRQPVIVRPSAETIQRATQLVSGTGIPPDTNCAICQDRIQTTETARKIISCNHLYHQHCIDRWFLRSVYCPTCRQDIREGRRTPLLSPSAGPALPPES